MKRPLVFLVATASALVACDGLLGIEDVSPPETAGGSDAGRVIDATAPVDAVSDAFAFDAASVDAAPVDAALLDAPMLGDVVPDGAPCELVDPASCGGPPSGCVYLWNTGTVACATLGASVTTCPQDPDCAPGYFCLGGLGGAPNTCVHWCRYGVPSDCTGGASCTPFSPTTTVDGTTYGYCS